MKLYYSFILLLICAVGNAQIVDIPDANFKFQLVNTPCVDTNLDQIPEFDADLNNDGEIQVSEAEAITGGLVVPWGFIDPVEDKIDDLTGIESFVNIQLLSIFGNDIIGELDLSPLTELTTVYADDNLLNSLIFENNPNLTVLYCGGNNLTTLDVSGAPALTDLGAIDNWLGTLDLSQNLNLVDARVEDNFLTDVTLPATDTFTTLYIGQNRLEQIDLSPASNLEIFWAYDNRFETFDPSVSPSLKTISLADNDELVSVDFSQNVNLIELDVRFNDGLRTFNLKNGNNENMEYMLATSNVSLECVVVDDVTATRPPCSGGFDGWCLGSAVILTETECILGLDDINMVNLELFPNPVEDLLTIQANGTIETVTIYSAQGVQVRQGIESIIDICSLSSGLYFAEITVDGVTATRRIIKE
ncbi:MAG: T9SS type A sorting domain-containing protein [Bacteroidota bacterium]